MTLLQRGLRALTVIGLVATSAVTGSAAQAVAQGAEPADRPSVQARANDDSCPADWDLSGRFVDVASGNPHARAVACLAHWNIARGVSETHYGPSNPVTRQQMASFIVRLVGDTGGVLAEHPADYFRDDDGALQAVDINRLAEAGIVSGTSPGRFDPQGMVTRAQMAVFLTRAYDYRAREQGVALLPAGADHFPDDDQTPLEPAIDKAAAAGFAGGFADGTYGPGLPVRRDQMASFLARVLDLMVEEQMAIPPYAPAPAVPLPPAGPPPPYVPPTTNVLELVSCTRDVLGTFTVLVRHTLAGGAWELPSFRLLPPVPHWNGEPVSAERLIILLQRRNPDQPIVLSAMQLRTIRIAAPGSAEPMRVEIAPPPDFVVDPAGCDLLSPV